MFLYFVLPALSFFLFLSKYLKKYLFEYFIIISVFFLCFGYMTGSDWRAYEPFYENIRQHNYIDPIMFRYEPGYVFLNYLFASLNVPFWFFFPMLKTILFITTCKVVSMLLPSKSYFFLFFVMVYSIYFLYQYIDNPMRNLIAATIFIGSIGYFIIKRKKRYLMISLLCPLFHISSIIVIIIIPFVILRHNKKILFVIYVVSLILFSSNAIFRYLITLGFGSNTYIVLKLQGYLISEYGIGKIFSLGFLLVNIFYAYFLFHYRNKIITSYYREILWNLGFVFLIVYRISLSMVILSRYQLFYFPFFYINIILVFNLLRKQRKAMFLLLIAFLSMYTSFSLIRSSTKYIPYTNIILHYNSNYDFYFRSKYNDKYH